MVNLDWEFLGIPNHNNSGSKNIEIPRNFFPWAHNELALNEVVYKKLDHFASGFHDI